MTTDTELRALAERLSEVRNRRDLGFAVRSEIDNAIEALSSLAQEKAELERQRNEAQQGWHEERERAQDLEQRCGVYLDQLERAHALIRRDPKLKGDYTAALRILREAGVK